MINIGGKLPYGGGPQSSPGGPVSNPSSLEVQLIQLQEELIYCQSNRTKLETFLADRVTDNANMIQTDSINTQVLVEKIQERESQLQQAEQQAEVLTKQINDLRDTVEIMKNEEEAMTAQLDVTKLSLTDAQSMLDQAEIEKVNFESMLTERNNEMLDIREECFNSKADLQA